MKYLIGFLIVIIIGLVGALAYFAGRNNADLTQLEAEPSILTPENEAPVVTVTPTPAVETKIVTSGGGVLSFPKYQLTVPTDWTFARQSENADSEQITLTGDGFTITISQGGFGGAMCLFPGDAELEGPSSRYDYFKNIQTQSGDSLRRAWSMGNFTGYAICQLSQYGWGAPTNYGHMSVKAAAVPNNDQVTILDSVLASLKKI